MPYAYLTLCPLLKFRPARWGSLLLTYLLLGGFAYGQDFRYGTLDWSTLADGRVEFRLELQLALPAGGSATVGESISRPGNPLRFGDGSQAAYDLEVTEVNSAAGHYTGIARLTHEYATPGDYTAEVGGCCWIPAVGNVSRSIFGQQPANWLLTARVRTGAAVGPNASPRFTVPALVELPVGSFNSILPVTAPLIATDADGDPIRFRQAQAPAERPGIWFPTPDVRGDTLTLNLFSPQVGDVYAVTAIAEDLDAAGNVKSSTQVAFLLQVTPKATTEKIVFTLDPAPPAGEPYAVEPFEDLRVSVTASTPGGSPDLRITSISDGSADNLGGQFLPSLPTPAANPVTTGARWTPADADWGLNEVTALAVGGQLLADTTFGILVNTPPTIGYLPSDYYDDFSGSYDDTVFFLDPDVDQGDSVAIRAVQLPDWMRLEQEVSGAARLAGNPTAQQSGTYEIILEVTDRFSGTYTGGEPLLVTFDLNVQIPFTCDLREVSFSTTDQACFDTFDGAVAVTVAGLNGTGLYTLYDDDGSRTKVDDELTNDASVTFTGLAEGNYLLEVIDLSIGEACSLEYFFSIGTAGLSTFYYPDSDGDGFGDARADFDSAIEACSPPNGYADNREDCDDDDATAFPGQTYYVDADADGYPERELTDCLRPAGAFLAAELTDTITDNCPGVPNPDQADGNGNGIGDACEFTPARSRFALEAECALVGGEWIVGQAATASNGRFAHAPTRRSVDNPPADLADNRIRFVLDGAAAGSYRLHVRAYTERRDGDSFWVRVNGDNWIKWNELNCARAFSWDSLSTRLDLAAGRNTLDLAFREGRAQLDKVFLSRDGDRPTDFGPPATNCTTTINQAPVAISSASAIRGSAPLSVTLDARQSYDSDGTLTTFNWSWAGGSAVGPNPTVVLPAGSYAIELTVADDMGATGSTQLGIEVSDNQGSNATAPFAFEAECTPRDRQWQPLNRADATNGKFITYTGCRCDGAPGPGSSDRYLDYDFELAQADTLSVFLRLDAPDVNRNSFWVRVNGGAWLKFWKEADGSALLTSGFEWRQLTDDARPVTFALAAGRHRVTIAPREPGTLLDKVLVAGTDAKPVGEGPAADNCDRSTTNTLSVQANEYSTAYDVADFTPDVRTVYPNPTDDVATVELSDGYRGEVRLILTDAMGRQLRDRKLVKQDRDLRHDLSLTDLPRGAYHLRIVQGDCQTVSRVVKM